MGGLYAGRPADDEQHVHRGLFDDGRAALCAVPKQRRHLACAWILDWPDGLPTSDIPDFSGDADSAGSAPTFDASAPLVLPALKELLLAYLEPAYLLSLLPRLSLPALSSLALDLEDDDYSDVLRYLASPRSLPAPPAPLLHPILPLPLPLPIPIHILIPVHIPTYIYTRHLLPIHLLLTPYLYLSLYFYHYYYYNDYY